MNTAKYILLLVSFFPMYLNAQNEKTAHISLVHGLSTQGDESKVTDYNISINLLSGIVHDVKGVQMGTVFNQVEGDMKGIQFVGILNLVKGNTYGWQSAGIANITSDVIGYQNASIFNYSGDVCGVQTAGLANIADDMKGVQASGIFNKAKMLSGFQIGLINVADSVSAGGGGIGVFNLYKKGGIKTFDISFADYQNIGLSFKSGKSGFYSIINAGYNITPKSMFSAGFGLGGVMASQKSIKLNSELMVYGYTSDELKFDHNPISVHWKLGIIYTKGKCGIRILPSVYYANIGASGDVDYSDISHIKPIGKSKNNLFGFGLSVSMTWMK